MFPVIKSWVDIVLFARGGGGLETKKCSKICRLEHFDSLKETS